MCALPCKTQPKSAKQFWRYFSFSIFKLAAIHHLGFSKFQIFTSQSDWEGYYAHHSTFHQNRSNSCGVIASNVFQNGGGLPSWIF